MRRFFFETLNRAEAAPLLLATYPILALLSTNLTQMDAGVALRPWIVSVAITLLLSWVLQRLVKDAARAGLLLSLGVVLFYSYGHVYNYLEQARPLGLMLGRHRYLAPLWLLLLVVGAWWVLKIIKNPAPVTQVLTTSAVVLLLFPLGRITSASVSSLIARGSMPEAAPAGRLSPRTPIICPTSI